MSDTAADPRLLRAPPKKGIRLSWADEKLRGIVWQVLVVGVVVSILWWLVSNTSHNLEVRRIATGWGFLSREAGLPIGEHVIDYNPTNTYARALLVGVLNTLKVAVIGILLATVFGTLIGIARLSKNWLLSRIAATYIEVIRDLPLLLQLLFWYAILQGLPAPRQSLNPVTGVFLSNRGLKLPWIQWQDAHSFALLGLVAGIVATIFYARAARAKQMADGQPRKVWPLALGLILGLPLLIWAGLGAPFAGDIPALRGFNFQGGLTITPEYFALLLGLVMYTAAFIAEIVRAGIQSVARGQWEAAEALGLQRGRIMRLIVLPQALRVIIPPMTSQYLNLTKNSSLAVAIGYQDIVSISNTTLNQTGQAIEGIAIIMAVYLSISLSISLFMNWYNARIALVER
ncbi:amino acid ABC transporter permease [Teichococcus vastitatis]|jgi:general L-amino acid transport system permease protein|uniref:Amino acid ABC transporter permease n=1 Tax=Teichococcus vastitatis TaxID=2307076 RepID=A0ABS9WDK4_9PROT|nr:amino acid ABC transporter permease [Pseudoroseomonas vastitatis]MCI0756825.1 amino acid ABC transporter permease [Pseudoroseomonas vastitatis]